jgi:hypothetical protein
MNDDFRFLTAIPAGIEPGKAITGFMIASPACIMRRSGILSPVSGRGPQVMSGGLP